MVYLKEFNLLSEDYENGMLSGERRTYFHNQYPLEYFQKKDLKK